MVSFTCFSQNSLTTSSSSDILGRSRFFEDSRLDAVITTARRTAGRTTLPEKERSENSSHVMRGSEYKQRRKNREWFEPTHGFMKKIFSSASGWFGLFLFALFVGVAGISYMLDSNEGPPSFWKITFDGGTFTSSFDDLPHERFYGIVWVDSLGKIFSSVAGDSFNVAFVHVEWHVPKGTRYSSASSGGCVSLTVFTAGDPGAQLPQYSESYCGDWTTYTRWWVKPTGHTVVEE